MVRHTEVLNENFSSGHHGGNLSDASLAVLDGLLGLGIEQTDAIVVAEASLFSNQHLEVLDGGIGAERDGRRELLDGLLRRFCGFQR